MSINYVAAVKNSRLQAVLDAINADAAAGYMEIASAGYAAVLATIVLAANAGAVAAGVLTLTMPQSDASADATGTAALARVFDGAGTLVFDGLTVGTTGTDVILTSTAITATDQVTINSAAITHA